MKKLVWNSFTNFFGVVSCHNIGCMLKMSNGDLCITVMSQVYRGNLNVMISQQ